MSGPKNPNQRKLPANNFGDKDDLYVPAFRLAHPTRTYVSEKTGQHCADSFKYKVSRYFENAPYRFRVAK